MIKTVLSAIAVLLMTESFSAIAQAQGRNCWEEFTSCREKYADYVCTYKCVENGDLDDPAVQACAADCTRKFNACEPTYFACANGDAPSSTSTKTCRPPNATEVIPSTNPGTWLVWDPKTGSYSYGWYSPNPGGGTQELALRFAKKDCQNDPRSIHCFSIGGCVDRDLTYSVTSDFTWAAVDCKRNESDFDSWERARRKCEAMTGCGCFNCLGGQNCQPAAQ